MQSASEKTGGTRDSLHFRSYRDETERHAHPYWQAVLPVKGRLDMEIGGQAGAVHPGQGALIPPHVDHAFQASGDNRFLVADVVSLRLPERVGERFSRRSFFPIQPSVRALMDFRQASPWPGEGGAAGHWCALLFHALDQAPAQASPWASAVARVVTHMQAHLGEALTLSQLAEIGGLPEHRLNAAFRGLHGQSPYAFLSQLRLREALRLLSETSLPIGEIAYRTGHADQSALTRRLRQNGCLPPAAYRRHLRSEMA